MPDSEWPHSVTENNSWVVTVHSHRWGSRVSDCYLLEFISKCWRQYSNPGFLTFKFMLLIRTVLWTFLASLTWAIVSFVQLKDPLYLNTEKSCKHFTENIVLYPFLCPSLVLYPIQKVFCSCVQCWNRGGLFESLSFERELKGVCREGQYLEQLIFHIP